MKDFYDLKDSTTTTLDKVSFIDFIVVNGYYPRFKAYCSVHPDIKSRKRLAIMFLRHINLYNIASKFVYYRISIPMKDFRGITL